MIGRAPDADVVVDHTDISRRHVLITRSGGAYAVGDLGSKNGTLLNGERLTGRRILKDGDELVLLGTILRFEIVDATRTATLSQPSRPVRLDLTRGELFVRGTKVRLTAKELRALEYMASTSGALVRKDDLANAVWPENNGIASDESIEQLMSRLRHKLEDDPARPQRLVTRRGLGYLLQLDWQLAVSARRHARPTVAAVDRARMIAARRERMALKGELGEFSVEHVLRLLQLSGQTGTLDGAERTSRPRSRSPPAPCRTCGGPPIRRPASDALSSCAKGRSRSGLAPSASAPSTSSSTS